MPSGLPISSPSATAQSNRTPDRFQAAALHVLILVASQWLVFIPMGALVAVMVMVSIGTFDWHSLRTLHRQPHGESLVMVTTVATVVATHDLAKGVIAGVLSALMFTRKIARYANMTSVLSENGRTRTYTVTRQLFFVTVTGSRPNSISRRRSTAS